VLIYLSAGNDSKSYVDLRYLDKKNVSLNNIAFSSVKICIKIKIKPSKCNRRYENLTLFFEK
jgi:hypothetical protein